MLTNIRQARGAPDYRALEAAVLDARGFETALDRLQDFITDIGFDSVLYGYIPTIPYLPNGEWLPLKLNLRNFPAGFEQGWERFMKIDPYYRASFKTTLPFDWKSVQMSDDVMHEQRFALNYLADYGLQNGMTIPAHLPFGKYAVMSVVSQSDRKWENLRENASDILFRTMHTFTKAIHDCRFEGQIPIVNSSPLTMRETECLKWASLGKTSAETAVIIDRSIETVRLHMKNAIHKLDATNRAQAVTIALQKGII